MQDEIRNREGLGEPQLLQPDCVSLAEANDQIGARAAGQNFESLASSSPAFMDNLQTVPGSLDRKIKKKPLTKIKREQALSLVVDGGLQRVPVKKEAVYNRSCPSPS